MLALKEMKIQNVPDALGCGRKRKASGYEYLRSRQENVEGQLHEETRVKAGLLVLLEQEKRKVKELAEQLMHTKWWYKSMSGKWIILVRS